MQDIRPGGQRLAPLRNFGNLSGFSGHLLFLIVLACVGWIYWPVMTAGYVWDDFALLVENGSLKTGSVNWEVLSQPVFSIYFRPVVLSSFVLETLLSTTRPALSHAVNFTLLLLNVGLVYAFASGLLVRSGSTRPLIRAALAAFLYGVHPALTESAAWISGRFDLMLATFSLLALNAEVYVRRRNLRVALVTLFFIAALGCKESAVVLPLALLLVRLAYDRAPDETPLRSAIRVLQGERVAVLSLGLGFAIYVVLRVGAIGDFATVRAPDNVRTFGGYCWLVLNTLVFYMKLIVVPFGIVSPINPVETYNVHSALNAAMGLFALAGIVAAAYLSRKGSVIGYLFLAGVVALLPALNIVPLSITDSIGHGRFLTLPLVFFSVALVSVPVRPSSVLRAPAQILILTLAATGWSVAAVATTHSIVPLWNNSGTLWSWAYATNPESRLAAAQLAVSALRSDQLELAGRLLEEIRRRHGGFTFHEQLFYSEYLLRTGNREEARRYLQGMTEVLPQYHALPDEAAARLEMGATSAAGILGSAYTFLAIADAMESRPEDSMSNLRTALWYQPQNPQLIIANALFLEKFDRSGDAKQMRDRARALVGEASVSGIEAAVKRDFMRYPGLASWFSDSARLTTETGNG